MDTFKTSTKEAFAPTGTFKNVLCALALALGSTGGAMAQTFYPVNFADNPAAGSAGAAVAALNTGTDAITYSDVIIAPRMAQPTTGTTPAQAVAPITATTLQVMVWDKGSNSTSMTLAWRFNGGGGANEGSIPMFGTSSGLVSDPDVALARLASGAIWAGVVYTEKVGSGNPQTKYDRYLYGNGTFTKMGTQPLGDIGFVHSNPNIDANLNGLIAVVWQQTQTFTASVSVTSLPPGLFSNFTYPQSITFDRSYLVQGTIDGTFLSCQNNNGTQGVVVSYPGMLYEQTTTPDVAVSEGTTTSTVVSVSYIRRTANGIGNYSLPNQLVVKQFKYNVCTRTGVGEPVVTYSPYFLQEDNPGASWDLPSGVVFGTSLSTIPRIAASSSSSNPADVQVVLNLTITNCGIASVYEIRNFGKSLGVWTSSGSSGSLVNSAFTSLEANRPAISYHGGNGNNYLITWQGTGYGSSVSTANGGGSGVDIWGVTYANGTPSITNNGYSRVNFNATGNQLLSSVAGRHTVTNGTSHLFVDTNKGYLSWKGSQALGGSSNFRAAPTTAQPAGLGDALRAYPNPSDGAVEFQLNLKANERVEQLLITDLMGRTIEQLPVPQEGATRVTWTPKRRLPTGNYRVKLTTNQRNESQLLERQ